MTELEAPAEVKEEVKQVAEEPKQESVKGQDVEPEGPIEVKEEVKDEVPKAPTPPPVEPSEAKQETPDNRIPSQLKPEHLQEFAAINQEIDDAAVRDGEKPNTMSKELLEEIASVKDPKTIAKAQKKDEKKAAKEVAKKPVKEAKTAPPVKSPPAAAAAKPPQPASTAKTQKSKS